MTFTLEELLKQKEDLVAKLNELENNNVELDEIVDDKEIIDEIKSLKEDIKEVNSEIKEAEVKTEPKEEVKEVKKDTKKEVEVLNTTEVKKEEEDNLETKIINIIKNTKQQKVLNKYKKQVELLVHNFIQYMDNLLDDYEKVRIITKKDIQEMNDEYQSLRNEFEAEFSEILNKLPEGTDFDKSLYQYIIGTFQEIEDDLDDFAK
jgi:DNA repair exonuclease SbcCD ATPase subunit